MTTSDHHRADHKLAQSVELSTQWGVDGGIAKAEADVAAVMQWISTSTLDWKDESRDILCRHDLEENGKDLNCLTGEFCQQVMYKILKKGRKKKKSSRSRPCQQCEVLPQRRWGIPPERCTTCQTRAAFWGALRCMKLPESHRSPHSGCICQGKIPRRCSS